jgi:hypothetical protein
VQTNRQGEHYGLLPDNARNTSEASSSRYRM